jgi:hypothetical protein
MTFRFQKLTVEQFRCFERLELSLEHDLTLLFAGPAGRAQDHARRVWSPRACGPLHPLLAKPRREDFISARLAALSGQLGVGR